MGGGGGGVGPHIKFGGKIWGKVRPSSPNEEKLRKFLYHKAQKLGKNPNFGVKSQIQRAKFGVFVTYIFGGKIWGPNKNFRGKFWGQAPPPRPSNMEVPPLGIEVTDLGLPLGDNPVITCVFTGENFSSASLIG